MRRSFIKAIGQLTVLTCSLRPTPRMGALSSFVKLFQAFPMEIAERRRHCTTMQMDCTWADCEG